MVVRGHDAGRAHAVIHAARLSAFPLFVCLSFGLSLLLGGGTRPGLLSDVVLQALAIPLLLWTLWKLAHGDAPRAPKIVWALLALIILLPLVQLLPLRALATAGGIGRQLQDEVAPLLGTPPSSSLTVAADVTTLSVLSLLPPVAIFIATLLLPRRHRHWLAFIVIGYAFVSVLLGLIQLSQGLDSPVRFYAITNREDAVGFFANRNHFSALLNCALVLTSAWLLFVASEAGLRSVLGPWRQVCLIAGFTLIVCLLAAQGMARSRAGVGLALVALLLSCAMMPGLVRPRDARANPVRALGVAVGLGLVLAIQYGTSRTVERFGADPLQDARRSFVQNTTDAILAYLPFGAGLGTFTQVYPTFERIETALVSAYVNRAHNDIVEYVLEGGVIAGLILGIGVIYAITRAVPLWGRSRAVTLDLMLQRASACVLILILLHSIVDYPLRTGAMLALLAVSAGLLMAAAHAPAEDSEAVASPHTESRTQHRSRSQAAVPPTGAEAAAAGARPAATSPPPRAAWGADMAWPEAWKTNGQKRDQE